ncbi:hypothetical protein MJ561_10100 [Klebsiella pneumoniae]|nr:hypothetical protein MJ561_10100 [Klebsiella pneumoniae]
MTSLNPVFTIGEQIAESCACTRAGAQRELRAAKKMLDQVRIPWGDISRHPHQLFRRHAPEGDDRHGASCRPAVLIADEPTTALDVTIQAQILQLIAVLQKEMAIRIFITPR